MSAYIEALQWLEVGALPCNDGGIALDSVPPAAIEAFATAVLKDGSVPNSIYDLDWERKDDSSNPRRLT